MTNEELYALICDIQNECGRNRQGGVVGIPGIDDQCRVLLLDTHGPEEFSRLLGELSNVVEAIAEDRQDAQAFYGLAVELIKHCTNAANLAPPPRPLRTAFNALKGQFQIYSGVSLEQLLQRAEADPARETADDQPDFSSGGATENSELNTLRQQALNYLQQLESVGVGPELIGDHRSIVCDLVKIIPIDFHANPQIIDKYVQHVCTRCTNSRTIRRVWQQQSARVDDNRIISTIDGFIATFSQLDLIRFQRDLERLLASKGREILALHAFNLKTQTLQEVQKQMRQWALSLYPDKVRQYLNPLVGRTDELDRRVSITEELASDVFTTLSRAKEQFDIHSNAFDTAENVESKAQTWLEFANGWAASVHCKDEADYDRLNPDIRGDARSMTTEQRLATQYQCARRAIAHLKEACRLTDNFNQGQTLCLSLPQIRWRRLMAEAYFLANAFAEAQLFIYTTELFIQMYIKKLCQDLMSGDGTVHMLGHSRGELIKEQRSLGELKLRMGRPAQAPDRSTPSTRGLTHHVHDDGNRAGTIAGYNSVLANIRQTSSELLSSAIVTADGSNMSGFNARRDIIFRARLDQLQLASDIRLRASARYAQGHRAILGGGVTTFGIWGALGAAAAVVPFLLTAVGAGFLYTAASRLKREADSSAAQHEANARRLTDEIEVRERLNAITTKAVEFFFQHDYIGFLKQLALSYGDEHPLLEQFTCDPPRKIELKVDVGHFITRLLNLDVPPDGVAYLLTLVAEAIIRVAPLMRNDIHDSRGELYRQAVFICQCLMGTEEKCRESLQKLMDAAEALDRKINAARVRGDSNPLARWSGPRNMPTVANLEEMIFIAALNHFIILMAALNQFDPDSETHRNEVRDIVLDLKRRMERGYGSQGYLDIEDRLSGIDNLLMGLGFPVGMLEAALKPTTAPEDEVPSGPLPTLTFDAATHYATPIVTEDMTRLDDLVEPLPLLHVLTGGSVTASESELREKITKLKDRDEIAERMFNRLAGHKLLRHMGLFERRYLPLLSALLKVQFDVYERTKEAGHYRHLPISQQPKVPEGHHYPIVGLIYPVGRFQRAPIYAFSSAMTRDIQPLSRAIAEATQSDLRAAGYLKRAQHYLGIAKAREVQSNMASLFYFKRARFDFERAYQVLLSLIRRPPERPDLNDMAAESVFGIVTCQLACGELRAARIALSDASREFKERGERALSLFDSHPKYLYLNAVLLRKASKYSEAEGTINSCIHKAASSPALPTFKREQAVIRALSFGTRAGAPVQSGQHRSDEQGWTCGLSIDGGGIRGTFPATILKCFEKDTRKPISKCYTVLGGTSTGGIIALALSLPKPLREGYSTHEPALTAGDVVKLYTSAATRQRIFCKRRLPLDSVPGGRFIYNAIFDAAKYDSSGRLDVATRASLVIHG